MIIPSPILRWLDEKKKTGSPEAGHSEKDRPGLDFKHQGEYRRTLYYSSLIPNNTRPSLRRSLLIHLHIYQSQNDIKDKIKAFWWDPDHSRIWSSKQVIEDSVDRRHMLPRIFLQTLKYSERFLAEGKDPSKGYLWKSFHVPCSDLGLHTERQMASGDALHIKLPPWHRIPPKPPWNFSESEPRIWLWGRVWVARIVSTTRHVLMLC